ncbi:cellulose synthase complex periplasmic endoglucanase BcsZ [Castellaniella defragrans]|uniref:cellulase n=1 Tax=Castellaniella defragrans TaxID=75697 RepID=A0A7W9TNW9_CASDE|nr:cellulose synthase complex periplasmic endoglucanase BcsZ [Castellaniella defragrans]KAB0601266.1 cellulase [Castellaniella defragrans]MBB6083308.1 endoglucanase [Castellaniella defragrans]
MRPAPSLAHAWRGAARQAWVLRACLACCVCLMLAPAAVRAQGDCMADWPLWQQFKEHFVEPDGRVLNARAGKQQSTSEGQSYAMFFALVAGDRKTFDQLWRWTVDNLAHGQAERRLPAWIWGQDPDSKAWGVMDANSAADADLWFVYALLEAGRLWDDPAYVRQAQALLVLIQAQEVSELPDLGTMLLPGREFFYTPEQGTWRLNPSYLPVFLLRRLQQASPRGPWDRIADNTLRMLRDVAPHGLAPDWTVYRYADQAAGFVPDAQSGATGSYDAIRVYLWAGMTAAQDPLRDALLAALGGMARIVGAAPQGEPPESVDARTGEARGAGPFGFSAALVPYFDALGLAPLREAQQARARALLPQAVQAGALQDFLPYYDFMLSLFGLGWSEGRFQFGPDGRLSVSWEKACSGTSK